MTGRVRVFSQTALEEISAMTLNAVMCVWNEEDIIESTVKHAFAQGCSNVFIIDNASTDKTVEIAIKSGAILADAFESKYFDETQKIARLNSVVKAYNERSSEEYVWWLYLDADEFPNIDHNLRIIDFITSLNPSVRLIHGYLFHHVPTHPPYNVRGCHPVDFMPVATKTTIEKIPLVRYDKGKQHLYSCGGAHTVDSAGESIPMIKGILNIHHFHYRRPENSIARLKLLLKKNADGSSRVDWMDEREQNVKKSKTAKSVYHDRCNKANELYNKNRCLSLLSDDLPYNYNNITRWHDNAAQLTACSDYDKALSQAIHYFFLREYDLALCRFNDALCACHDDKISLLIYAKIAYCLAKSNKNEAIRVLSQIMKCEFSDVKAYTEKVLEGIVKNSTAISCENTDTTINVEIVTYFKKYENQIFV